MGDELDTLTDGLFTWIPFYEELADRLVPWRTQQTGLIQMLGKLRAQSNPVQELKDIGADGKEIPLAEIDPFTIFALFNRGMTDENRHKLAAAVGQEMKARACRQLSQMTLATRWTAARKLRAVFS